MIDVPDEEPINIEASVGPTGHLNIIGDGWAYCLSIRELSALYQASNYELEVVDMRNADDHWKRRY